MQYNIIGGSLPAVTCELQAGETMITESGSMAWMTPRISMKTNAGGLGKALSRLFSGENIFLNYYTAEGGPGQITFASSFPGSIIPVEVQPGKEWIVQKTGFLAATKGVDVSAHFQKRFGAGFWGGEGFIMQRLSGNGIAFLEIDGHAVEHTLQRGEEILVSTGHLAAMEASCKMEIKKVNGIKNIFLGGEGLFHTVVKGPGRVILQTMPIGRVAETLKPYFPAPSSKD